MCSGQRSGATLRSFMDELSVENRQIVRRACANLANEFVGVCGPETVERCVADSLSQLTPTATIPTFLPLLAERFARERLRAMAGVQSDRGGPPGVVFLCAHNASRSQIAAAWLRHLCPETVMVWSAGTEPAAQVSDVVTTVLAEVGIDITGEFPKPWTDEVIEAADVIVTMGCGEACPILPGKRYEDWVLLYDIGQGVEHARAARDEIRGRVEKLAVSLRLGVR